MRRHSHGRHPRDWHRQTSPWGMFRMKWLLRTRSPTTPTTTTSPTFPTSRRPNTSTPLLPIINIHIVILIYLVLPDAFAPWLLRSVAVSLVLCAILRGDHTRRSTSRGHATDTGEHFCCSLVGHNPILRDRRPTWSCWNPLTTLDHSFLH